MYKFLRYIFYKLKDIYYIIKLFAARNIIVIDGVLIDISDSNISKKIKFELARNSYEAAERQLLKYLPNNEPIIELGAAIGVLSCIINSKLVSPKQHIAVEADPRLQSILQENRQINKCEFKIIHAALAYNTEYVSLFLHDDFWLNSTSEMQVTDKMVTVPATTLEKLAYPAGFKQFNLICDIEGSEFELIDNEISFIQENVNWLLIEIHDFINGQDKIKSTEAKLKEKGFELIDNISFIHCYRNSKFV